MVTTTGFDSSATATSSTSSIGSSILLTLGSGSGINVQELATNLTNAEKLPAQSILQGKIDKTEAKISGYGLISSQLGTLANAFEKINDANEIYSTAGISSNERAISFLSVTNDAAEAAYDINVYQLAENHRLTSNSFQTSTGHLNSSAAFDLTLSIGTTRIGTYDHLVTEAQLQAIGDGTNAYIEYSDGSNTLQINQSEIDTAMESLEGTGVYSFENATLEGLIKAINNEISSNSGFAGKFASAELHRTKGISFVQTTAGAPVSLAQSQASNGTEVSNLGTVSQGIISAAPIIGSPASYSFAPTSIGTDTLEVSDGTTTLSIPSTDFTARADYELSITQTGLQTALAHNNNTGTISISGTTNSGSETLTVGLADMTTFGIAIPLGSVTLNNLANAFNNKASANFQTRALVDDNKLTFVQKTNGTGNVSNPVMSAGSTSTTTVAMSPVRQMAEAIQALGAYNNLKFTVRATSTDLIFDYKADEVVSTPTFSLNGASQTTTATTVGVTSVNAPVNTIINVAAGTDTLAGVVEAINSAKTGVTAALLDVSGIGNDYRIVLSGDDGRDGTVTVGTTSSLATSNLGFNVVSNVIQAAQDAQIGYEGLLINRGSNVISDVIEGATFQLNSTTGQVTSTPYTVLANGSGHQAGFVYDITLLNANTVTFTPKAAYVGENLGAGPSGGPQGSAGYVSETITNPYGSSPATITRYKVTPINNSDIDTYLDNSANPDTAGSITLYDGIGGSLILPRNGMGGFWPTSTATENGETIGQYVAVAQAASYAAGFGTATTGGTEDTYTSYTGGTINPVSNGNYYYPYTQAQLRTDVAASITASGNGRIGFTDDFGETISLLASDIRTLSSSGSGSGGTSTSAITIANASFESQTLTEGSYTNSVVTGWTITTSGGNGGVYNVPANKVDESTITGNNAAFLYTNGSISQSLAGQTYHSDNTYQFQVSIGDDAYYNSSAASYTVKLYAGITLIGSASGSTSQNKLSDITLNSNISNASLNGQTLKIEVSKTGGAEELLIDNVRGTVTAPDNGNGTFRLSLNSSTLQAALNTNQNASGNTYVSVTDGSGHTLMVEAAQNQGGGTNFSSYSKNTLRTALGQATVRAGSSPVTSAYANFDFTITQDVANGNLVFTPKAGVSNPTVSSVLVSSASSPTWQVGSSGSSSINFAYTTAQLRADLLNGAIHGAPGANPTDDHSYISFTDTNGNTIMVSRDDGAGAELTDRSDYGGDGTETIKNLAETLQVAAAKSGSNPTTTSYASFDYTVGYDSNGLTFALKAGRALGNGTFTALRSGQSSSGADGQAWKTAGSSSYGANLSGTAVMGSTALGTITETQSGAAGTETLAGLVAAIQAHADYPANFGSNNTDGTDDLRFTVALSGDGLMFTSQGTPRNPASGVAMFTALRTSSSDATHSGALMNTAMASSFQAQTTTPATPTSGNYSNTGVINSTVGTTGSGTFRLAYSDADLRMDLLAGRINDVGDSNMHRAYISFTDSDGDTVMVQRSDIGSTGSETIAGLVSALQSATAGTSTDGFARHNYASFDYNIMSDASGLVFTPKTSPASGDTLSLQMRRSRNNTEYASPVGTYDGDQYATEAPLRHTIIEDAGLIPGTPGTDGGAGVTYLNKYRTDTIYDTTRLTVSRDKSQLKNNLQDIVASYNDLETLIDELNTDDAIDAGLSLAGEGSLLRSVQKRIYNALTASSSTASGAVDAVRDLGISVNRYGKLEFNETKYDSLIKTNWDDVVTMLTAGTTNQSLFSASSKGLGQDVATIINGLKASTLDGDSQNGLIANRTAGLTKSEESYQVELTKLEARMSMLYQRYLNQFTAMETLMNSLNTTRDYMKGQLDVITSAYDND